MVEPDTPAWKSLGYAIGTFRISGAGAFDDTSAHAYNAELVKQLTPAMQRKMAGLGGPLGHRVSIDHIGTGVVINFIGKLQSADDFLGPWNDVEGATNQYPVSAQSGARFYRAVE